jgi:translocation and assembly module TamA
MAQQPAPPPPPTIGAEIDPNAPLDAMPDLGVAWPDMAADPIEAGDAKEAGDLLPSAIDVAESLAPAEAIVIDDGTSARRYGVTLAGLDAIETGEIIRGEFDRQSTLAKERKASANAAQIDRRTRADVELLKELLNAQGYYDAEVEPDITIGASQVAIRLQAVAGKRYRFEAVDLPGLDGAGGDAAALRASFAVKAGDAVVAQEVIAAGTALRVCRCDHWRAIDRARRGTWRGAAEPAGLARTGWTLWHHPGQRSAAFLGSSRRADRALQER